MAFSLSNWFKGKPPGPDTAAAPEPAKPAPAKAPAARSGATRSVTSIRKAIPNSVQPVSLRDPASRPSLLTSPAPPGSSPHVRVTSVVTSRKINFGNPAAVAATYPSETEPVAPEPAVPVYAPPSIPDVAVILEVSDFIDKVPGTLLAAGHVDRQQQVEFRSSELYSDLARGRASVPASVIYQKCPELFARPVSETEDAEISLPLAKLVEQLTPALQTRADQIAEENVSQIETPFLQVAMEDNERLPAATGTSAGAIRPANPLPATDVPVRPAHRTGQIQTITIPRTAAVPEPVAAVPAAPAGPINPGKRPPSTVRASVAGGKIRLSGPTVPQRIALNPTAGAPPPATAPFGVPPLTASDLPPSATQRIATPVPALPTALGSPSHQVTKKTQRIQIPPISLRTNPTAGASPARPNVPPPPAVPVQASPVAVRPNGASTPGPISFRSSPPPPPSAKPVPLSFAPPPLQPAIPPPPEFPAMPSQDNAPTPAPALASSASSDERLIGLGLAAILRGVSTSLLTVDPSSIPDDVRIALPFATVVPQLSTGRVNVPRDIFVQALPDAHKGVLDATADLPAIPLPLQEVFQNLPSSALAMRQDQVSEEIAHLYPTPFSQKAEEDAQRLGVGEISGTQSFSAPEGAAPAAPSDHSLPANENVVAKAPEPAMPVPQLTAPAESRRDIPLDLDEKLETVPDLEVEEKSAAPVPPPELKIEILAEVPLPPEVPVAEAASQPAPITEPSPTVAHNEPEVRAGAARQVPVVAKGKDSELQVLFMTDDELDAKTVVRLVSEMPGLDGCAVMFGDGLRLAGNFPEESTVEGFSAIAPPFYKRAKAFASDTGVGSLTTLTLHTDHAPCSFLMYDDICLAVRHANRGFMPGVREKLEIVVRELARMYT